MTSAPTSYCVGVAASARGMSPGLRPLDRASYSVRIWCRCGTKSSMRPRATCARFARRHTYVRARGGTMKKGRTGAGSGRTVRDPAANRAVSLPVASTRFPSVVSCINPSTASACAHTQCRYHLKHRGPSEHHLNPTRDCSLTFANEGSHTLDEIAEAFGVSVERIRQIEERALGKLRGSRTLRGAHDDSE